MATREKNWEHLLDEAINRGHTTRFEWGKHDCALFVADAVLLLTGDDYAEPFRNKYTNQRGAYKILKKLTGADDWRDGLAQWMGMTGLEAIEPEYAQRGDVVLANTDDGPALAVVGNPGTMAYAAAPKGLSEFPVVLAERGWRVTKRTGNSHNGESS